MTIKVNGEKIPEQAIEYELLRLVKFYSGHMSKEQIRKQMDFLKNKAKEQAIGAKLLIAEAERLNLCVSDEVIEDKIQKIIESSGGKDAFESLLENQKLTKNILKKSIRQGCRVDMLTDKISEGISDPTEAEMKTHFEAHKKEYSKPERVQALHILISVESDDEKDWLTAESKLKEIKSQIEAGADFSELASLYSDCPSGKKTGGSLGWFSRGMMVPEFDKIVFSIKVGELSDVIRTNFGCHIIRKTDEEKESQMSFHECREKIHEFLRHSSRGMAISKYVNDLKKKAVIEEI